MNGESACADIGAYVLGVLDGAETARFEDHLPSCPWCADEIQYLRPLQELLHALVGQRPDFFPADHVDPIGHGGDPWDQGGHWQRSHPPATGRACCRGGVSTRGAARCVYRRRR